MLKEAGWSKKDSLDLLKFLDMIFFSYKLSFKYENPPDILHVALKFEYFAISQYRALHLKVKEI